MQDIGNFNLQDFSEPEKPHVYLWRANLDSNVNFRLMMVLEEHSVASITIPLNPPNPPSKVYVIKIRLNSSTVASVYDNHQNTSATKVIPASHLPTIVEYIKFILEDSSGQELGFAQFLISDIDNGAFFNEEGPCIYLTDKASNQLTLSTLLSIQQSTYTALNIIENPLGSIEIHFGIVGSSQSISFGYTYKSSYALNEGGNEKSQSHVVKAGANTKKGKIREQDADDKPFGFIL